MNKINPPTTFPPAPLTLHLEANSMAELMDMLDAVMGQLNPDHVSAATSRMGEGVKPNLTLDVHASKEDADEAAAAANTTKRGRGRPKKSEEPEAEAETQPEPQPEPQPEATPAINPMVNHTPAEARKKGIEAVQTYFAQNPACLPQVTAISQKYGVAQFADIPDDKAHAFLSDILLLTNGSGAV